MNRLALIAKIKGSPDSEVYKCLVALLQMEKDSGVRKILSASTSEELIRLQGQAQVLSTLLTELTRKPIDKAEFKTGAFS